MSATTWELKKNKNYPALKENLETDVVIVGGGLAGVWCAYTLAEVGKSVVLLEKDKIGMGETVGTTAFITQSIDTSLTELVKIFGSRIAQLVWVSGIEAIDKIEKTVRKEKIDCDFMRLPMHIYARNEGEFSALEEEHKLAKKFGYKTSLQKFPLKGFSNYGSLKIEKQAKYHPEKFLQALAEKAAAKGVLIFEKSEVSKISGNGPVRVSTKDGFNVRGSAVAVMTYDPLGNPKATRFKKGMYTSNVLELEIMKGVIEEGLYIDQANPYHYLRVDQGSLADSLIIGGEDFRSELKIPKEKNFSSLKDYVDKMMPDLKYKTVKKWQGNILEPSDGLPLIGETSPGRYVACAFSGNGMTYSAIAGEVIRDLILNKRNKFKKVYDPQRSLKLKALAYKARDYTEEFFGGAAKNFLK